MTLVYALNFALNICLTNVRAQKIVGSTFKIFVIVLASLLVENTLSKSRFF